MRRLTGVRGQYSTIMGAADRVPGCAAAVKAIGNEEDLTKLNLEPVLSHSMIMVVTVTATTTVGKPLDAQQLQVVMEAADHILQVCCCVCLCLCLG